MEDKTESVFEVKSGSGLFSVDRQSTVTISAPEIIINPELAKCNHQS